MAFQHREYRIGPLFAFALWDSSYGWLVKQKGTNEETARNAAKTQMKQKYLNKGLTVPDWLNE